MKIRIEDNFPIARIYFDDVEVEDAVKYQIKRTVDDLPIVKITFKPRELSMNLKEVVSRKTGVIYFIKNALAKLQRHK